MTNEENLKSLSTRELAWFLMAYSNPCRTCIYKKFHTEPGHNGKFLNPWSCKDIPEDEKLSCIDATQAWLERETTDADDVFMFKASRNNVTVEEKNREIERYNAEVLERMEHQEDVDAILYGEEKKA